MRLKTFEKPNFSDDRKVRTIKLYLCGRLVATHNYIALCKRKSGRLVISLDKYTNAYYYRDEYDLAVY